MGLKVMIKDHWGRNSIQIKRHMFRKALWENFILVQEILFSLGTNTINYESTRLLGTSFDYA